MTGELHGRFCPRLFKTNCQFGPGGLGSPPLGIFTQHNINMSNEEKSSLHNLLRGFWKKPIIWVAIVFTLSFLAMVLEFFGFLDWVPRWPVR